MATERPYVSYANQLRQEILLRRYGVEGGLPGVDELVRRSKLARNTIYKSLAILQGEGIIIARDNGFFVSLPSITMTQYVPPLAEQLKVSGKVAFTRNLDPVENTILPDYIADRLNLEHGTACVYRHRIGGELTVDSKEKPTRLIEYYYLIPILAEQLERLNSEPTTDILFESAPAQMIREDTISARHLTEEESKLLGLPEATPVISMQITNTTMKGEYLLVQESVFVGVSFTYRYSFENRPKS